MSFNPRKSVRVCARLDVISRNSLSAFSAKDETKKSVSFTVPSPTDVDCLHAVSQPGCARSEASIRLSKSLLLSVMSCVVFSSHAARFPFPFPPTFYGVRVVTVVVCCFGRRRPARSTSAPAAWRTPATPHQSEYLKSKRN